MLSVLASANAPTLRVNVSIQSRSPGPRPCIAKCRDKRLARKHVCRVVQTSKLPPSLSRHSLILVAPWGVLVLLSL